MTSLRREITPAYRLQGYQGLKCGKGDYVTRFTNHAKFGNDRMAVAPKVVVKYTDRVPFFLLFLTTRTAQTHEPISMHNSSKDAV